MVLLPARQLLQQPLVLAPDTAPCPRCHTLCSRHERIVLHRLHGLLDGPAKRQTAIVGAYLCPDCPTGDRWFRLQVPGFVSKQRYSPATKRTLASLITIYNLSFAAAADFGRTQLHLPDLHQSTLARWYIDEGAELDYQSHLQQALDCFSGQLAVDELYDNGLYVLKVTDPLNDIEITSWLGVGSPDSEEIRALFRELKAAGFEPLLVVTDGSKLYPGPLSEVWPQAEHQLCVFHFLQGALVTLSGAFWAAYRTMPQPKKRGRGRPKKRGRPRKDKTQRLNQKKVRAVRYLVFKRAGFDERGRPKLSDEEQDSLEEALTLCPALVELRRFVCTLYELFGPDTTSAEAAEGHRQQLLCDPAFHDDTAMAKVLARLADNAQWQRLIRYHDFEGAKKTSNHVERQNREYRRRQRSHYRLRSFRSLWALLNHALMSRPMPTQPVRLTRRRPSEVQPQEVAHP